jgi:uncharacterized membrane-anchored protein
MDIRSKFWKTFFIVTAVSLVIGVLTGIYQESVLMGILGYFMASFIGTTVMMFKFVYNQMVDGEDDGKE